MRSGYLIAIGAALIYAVAQSVKRRILYEPARYPLGNWDVQAELGAEDVWLSTRDGLRLHAWWLAAPGSRLVSIYFHGNGGNISHRPGHLRGMLDAGSAVLSFDYRGYGRSPGWPSERGFYRDADAAYDHVIGLGYQPNQIVLHGESIGSAVAVDLAVRRPCAAVILECPFTSISRMAGRIVPMLGPMLVHGFNVRRKIRRMHVPLLVIHGDDDRRIPLAIGRDLFEAAHQPKEFWTVPGARHLTIVQAAGAAYADRLRLFYNSILRRVC